MRIGVHVPQWGPGATRDGVLSVAVAAEEAGFDSVWVADHIAYPTRSESRYPYREDGLPFGPEEGFLEALTTLAVIAGATGRVRLGTSVLVLPMREPLLVAKTVATLDVLSGGRVVLAVGAGWWAEEFAAVGAPFAGRGRRMDEQLRILRSLWTDGVAAHGGQDYAFAEVACLPLPLQRGGPPVLVGGMGETSWRRAGALGDGWHAIGYDRATLVRGRDEVLRLAAAAGRDPATMRLSTSTGAGRTPERAIERLSALAAIGFTDAVLNVPGDSAGEAIEAIASLGRSVLPHLPRSTADS